MGNGEDKCKTWKMRAERGVERPIAPLLDKNSAAAERAEADAYIRKHARAGKRGDKGLVELPCLDGGTASVGLYEKKGLLGRVTGYAEACDGKVYAVVGITPLAPLLLLLALAASILLLWTLFLPASSPLVTGGVVPIKTVQVADPAEVGQIRIPGYNGFDVSEGTVVELSNPDVNENYLFKYTIETDGQTVHETPYWIEAGKVEQWSAYEDLKPWSGKEIDVHISISAIKADTHAQCNGASQIVRVGVR